MLIRFVDWCVVKSTTCTRDVIPLHQIKVQQIKKNWEELVLKAHIEPEQCIEELAKLKRSGNKNIFLQKRNVLGCYLAQNSPYVCHGADVFNRFLLEFHYTLGNFSKEEDALILNEVEKNGANSKTWAKLKNLMKRSPSSSVKRRYELISQEKDLKTGKWDKEEFYSFFKELFSCGVQNEMSLSEFVMSRTVVDIQKAGCNIQRLPENIYRQWNRKIRPVLLAYDKGILYKEWRKPFLQYVVEKKYISLHDIDWQDATLHFPCHTAISFNRAFSSVLQSDHSFYSRPLFESVRDYLSENHKKLKIKKQDDEIVALCNKARGLTEV